MIGNGFRRGDPEAGPDEGRQEAVKLHVRESRHATPAARGLGKRQDAGQRVRIIVKCFIEIPDAHEQNRAGVLAFQLGMLLEKRAGFLLRHFAVIVLFTAFAALRNDRAECVASI